MSATPAEHGSNPVPRYVLTERAGRAPRTGEAKMVVGVLRLTLYIPENHSLKGKRGVLRKIKARVGNEFNVSIAECDGQDLWQRAVLGVSQVGSDAAYVEGALRQVVHFIEGLHVAEVGEEDIQVLHC